MTAPGSGAGRRISFAQATEMLAARDPVLAGLIEEAGPMRLGRPTMSPFAALVQAIVYQQLAGAAARAIHGRLVAALEDEIRPEGLLALTDETLRAVGLSGAKVRSLRDLAAKVLDETVVLTPRGLSRQSDEEVVARLTSVRGIGPWSAQMFMIFQLRRLDVWAVLDLGVRRGYGIGWKVPTPTARELEPVGDAYRPYRTVLTWYCWRADEVYGGVQSALTG